MQKPMFAMSELRSYSMDVYRDVFFQKLVKMKTNWKFIPTEFR